MKNEVVITKGDKRLKNKGSPLEVEGRKRACAYCRVSTDKEDQQNSLKTQEEHYRQYIDSNDEWVFAGIYSDEGISGTQTKYREGFLNMIRDCKKGKIDLIITKSISRFSRNITDTMQYIRELKKLNIAVYFENENINTLDTKSEFVLSILSSVAQQEVENISSNVNAALKHKMSNGKMIGQHDCLGYDYNPEDNQIYINSEEAKIVKYIFRRYLEMAGAHTIARELTDKGFKTLKGNSKWSESTIRSIIKNEVYTGTLVQGKTYTVSTIDHLRSVNHGESDTYTLNNHHEPIISMEDYNKAQEIRKLRAKNRKERKYDYKYPYSKQYAFSSMMICGCCNSRYIRRDGDKWQCRNYAKQGKVLCKESKTIEEGLIESAFIEAFVAVIMNNEKGQILDTFLKDFVTATKNEGFGNKLKSIKTKINNLIIYEDKLIKMKIDGQIDDETYDRKYKENKKKMEELKVEQSEYQQLANNEDQIYERISGFRNQLSDLGKINKFDRAVFEAVVDNVIIGGYNNDNEFDPFKITFIFKTSLNGDDSNKKIEYVTRISKKKSNPSSANKTEEGYPSATNNTCRVCSKNTKI